jgi:hypothetical protein
MQMREAPRAEIQLQSELAACIMDVLEWQPAHLASRIDELLPHRWTVAS